MAYTAEDAFSSNILNSMLVTAFWATQLPLVLRRKLFELLQKSHIVIEHQPYIVKRIHQSTHAFEAKTKRKAGIYCRIDAAAF